jgi:DNA-binding beta-propeller fold protein YncE
LPFGVAVNPVTDRIYVSNLGDSNLSVIRGSTNTIEANIFIGLASNVVAANRVTGRIYAASTGNELSVVDGRLSSPTYNTVLSSVGSFSGSNDVAVNPNTNLIYLMGGSLLKIFDDSISSPSNAIAALINWVRSLSLAQGTTNSLTSKLTNALSALESPNGSDANTACNKLDAFINEVQAQEQKQQLTAVQVRELTTEAQLIKTALGCN